MNEMIWTVKPTVDGLLATVVRDEPFVDHSPSIGKQGSSANLTKVRTPFDGYSGKWAFASLMPLTHRLLSLFPADVLKLMRGEIYARYGDTFRDPETQRYFDAQPWYKRSKRTFTLTAIERFNVQMIKAAEARAAQNLLSGPAETYGHLNYVYYLYRGMARGMVDKATLERQADGKVAITGSGYRDTQQDIEGMACVGGIAAVNGGYIAYSLNSPVKLLDGDRWELEIRFDKRNLCSSGRNAEPENSQGLNKMRQLLFDLFCENVNNLTDEERARGTNITE